MKSRVLFCFLLASFLPVLYGCEETPPEKTVGSITFVITEEHTLETLSGVSIQLFSDEDPAVTPTDRTDNSGRCTFSNIPIGAYHMNLSKPGYESKEGLTQRINGGDNPNKEISLKRATTELTVAPNPLDFGSEIGVVQKAFSLVNPNYEELAWSVMDPKVDWIVSVCDKDGNKSGYIKYNQEVAMSVTIDRGLLPSGAQASTIVILSNAGQSVLEVKAIGEDREEPTVNILDETTVTSSTATLKGEITSPGVPRYEERGFYYSDNKIDEKSIENNPAVVKVPATVNYDAPHFEGTITGLVTGKTYYAIAYVINRDNHALSKNQISFTPSASTPKVIILEADGRDISNRSIVLNGEVIDVGDPSYIEKGFVYSQDESPNVINNNKVVVEGSGKGKYSAPVTNLELDKTYYAKAYLIQMVNNNKQTYYSENSITLNLVTSQPAVTLRPISNEDKDVNRKQVKLRGSVDDCGTPVYVEKGFVCGETASPTIDDFLSKVSVEGNNAGEFSSIITNLSLDKTYYARAYIRQMINGKYSTYYSNVESFSLTTTPPSSTMITVDEMSYSSASAKVSGRITDVGIPAYTRRGFVYGFSSNPKVENSQWRDVSGSGTEEFSLYLSNLTRDKKYYVRVYTEQNGNIFYSENECAFCLSPVPAELGAITISDVGNTSAKATCSISKSGDPEYSEKGFVYNCDGNPNIDKYIGKIPVDGLGTGQFSATLSNLSASTTYYVKAYVRQNGHTYYSSEQSFKTGKQIPVVNTNSASSVAYTSATLNATVTNVGNPPYDRRGFYYGTNKNPTASNSTVYMENAHGFGDFSTIITGLSEGVTYYFRAYVIQSGETIVGSIQEFTTGHKPNVTTGGVLNVTCSGTEESNLNWSGTLYGGLSYAGDPAYTSFGFVYGTSNAPVVDDGASTYITTTRFDVDNGSRIYYTTVSGFKTGVAYHIRAVASTPFGYVYGDPVEFTPTVIPPAIRTYSTQCEKTNGVWAVAFVGVAGSLGQPQATGLGFVYSLNNMPSVGDSGAKAISYSKIEKQDGYYVFGVATSDLAAGKTYYVRAYAKTPLGYTYGEVLNFKTY